MVAFAGAGPWPQITSVLPARTSLRMTGTSPPGPLRCGSTTCSVNAVATAASNALPPFSKIAMPTAVAIQWVEATAAKVPSISGRVVNGLGLMLPIVEGSACGGELTTGARPGPVRPRRVGKIARAQATGSRGLGQAILPHRVRSLVCGGQNRPSAAVQAVRPVQAILPTLQWGSDAIPEANRAAGRDLGIV